MIRFLPAFGIAALIAAVFLRARWNYRRLPALFVSSPATPPPDCMVVIPARNEERSIGRAVRSFPPDTVIVVDDHSTDTTAEEASRAGAGVLPAPPLPKRAAGKAHACMVGARVLTSQWILFADADTWYGEHFLDAAVRFAESAKLDLLSIRLDAETRHWPETMLVPYLSALFCIREPVFSGQCLLARREPYEFIGGHSAVLRHLADDVKLAALSQRHRLRSAVASAGGLGHARMYEGWSGIWNGLERSALRFTHAYPHSGVAILAIAACSALWLPAVVWLWLVNQHFAAGILAALPFVLLWPWYGVRRVCFAPLAIYVALPIVYRAFLRVFAGRPVEWKGRTIS